MQTRFVDLPLPRRLALAFALAAGGLLVFYLAWAGQASLSSGRWAWPRMYESWPIELSGFLFGVFGLAAGPALVALFRPQRVRAWLACAAGGVLLWVALEQVWIVQLSRFRNGAGPMDFTQGIRDLSLFHGAMWEWMGWAYPLSKLLTGLRLAALVLWAWLAGRERFGAGALALLLFPLVEHSAQVGLLVATSEVATSGSLLLVLPNLAVGAFQALSLCAFHARARHAQGLEVVLG